MRLPLNRGGAIKVATRPALSPGRTRRLKRATRRGVKRWNKSRGESGKPEFTPSPLLPERVRKRLGGPVHAHAGPSMMRKLDFPASRLRIMMRLFVFFFAMLRWWAARLVDRVRGLDTIERRAARLRDILQGIGGTAVKVGQQAAMRIDLLPYPYSVELSKMLDRMPTFPVEHAIERIEARMGKPIDEVFANFDPEPIGSASVACVYQAYLPTGERVAVKVRRPDIGVRFAADCGALAAVLKLLELLTLIRPGLSHNFLFEFRSMLMEELDFTKEARYQELFRRGVRKNLRYISAPRVLFDYSFEDVLVTEFVTGIWLRELISAVEQKDEEALAYLKKHRVDPRVVARRLLRANQYGIFENVLFHADPHPSNVVVRPNNKLVFIDFGSCGAYTGAERVNWRQLAYYHDQADIGRMVQSALAILEPLPPLDIDEFSKRLEMVFWQDLYAFKSKHSEWWERTSAKIWISFLELTREYAIPMNLNTLRMIRSTLLYETIAARLYPRVSAYREHRRYNRNAGKRAKRRVQKQLFRWFFKGPSNDEYLRIEQVMNMGNRALYLAQRYLDSPPYRFSLLISKAVYAATITVRGLLVFFFGTLLVAFGTIGYRLWNETLTFSEVNIWTSFGEALAYPPYQLLLILIIFLNTRRVLFRLFDKDVTGDNSTGLK